MEQRDVASTERPELQKHLNLHEPRQFRNAECGLVGIVFSILLQFCPDKTLAHEKH